MEIKDLLRECGFRFEKKFGQNFLTDGNLLSAIVSDAGVTAEDTVVEIGAGAGTLTAKLAGAAGRVIAFEIDENLRKPLAAVLGQFGNVETVFGDVMDFSMEEIENMAGGPYKVVANLPYYITTPVIMKFIEQSRRMTSMTVMVQKEVAERLAAKPATKEYGRITVAADFFGGAVYKRTVPRSMFYPAPNVDSAVVRIDRNKRFDADGELFRKVVKSAFAMRRKILSTCLASGLGIGKEKAAALIEMSGHSPSVRGETLSAEDFAVLTNVIKNNM